MTPANIMLQVLLAMKAIVDFFITLAKRIRDFQLLLSPNNFSLFAKLFASILITSQRWEA